MTSNGEHIFRFRDWRIVISIPEDDFTALRGTIGATWPNLMLQEAVEGGAKVSAVTAYAERSQGDTQ